MGSITGMGKEEEQSLHPVEFSEIKVGSRFWISCGERTIRTYLPLQKTPEITCGPNKGLNAISTGHRTRFEPTDLVVPVDMEERME